jgi:hypothetical protein
VCIHTYIHTYISKAAGAKRPLGVEGLGFMV